MPSAIEPRTASAVTRQFFALVDASDVPLKSVCSQGGIHINTAYCWKSGKAAATVLNMEAVLFVLGLELFIRPIKCLDEHPTTNQGE